MGRINSDKTISSLFFKYLMSESDEPSLTHDIDWPMLDKARYVPLSVLSTFIVRSLLYPITLVRTRLQVQVQSSIYKGTWHALHTTVRYEGFRSLYKGFLVYNCQLVPGLIYITTFEATRARATMLTKNEYVRAGIGGTIGSLCSLVLACPIDIISQHMQLVGLTSPSRKTRTKDGISSVSDTKLSTISSNRRQQRQIRRIHVPKEIRSNNYLIFKHIFRTLLYEKTSDIDSKPRISLRGFYRGYLISTFLFSLTSAIWWPSYYFYQKQLLRIEKIFRKIKFLSLIYVFFLFLSEFISITITSNSMYCWSFIVTYINYANKST
jgi:solute carrier family 25 protein 44